MAINKYSFKKTAKKFWIDAAIVIATGLVVIWQDDVKYVILVPFLKAGLNWLKHRKG